MRFFPKRKPKPEKIHASKDLILLTTETTLDLKPCNVRDDHKIKFKKKEVEINPGVPEAHTLTIYPRLLWPTFLGRLVSPKLMRFRVYTARKEGEITHNPHEDSMNEEEKMKLEKILQIAATAKKADIAGNIMKGLKDKSTWVDFIPYIVIFLIVLLFLFSFQIQPNM